MKNSKLKNLVLSMLIASSMAPTMPATAQTQQPPSEIDNARASLASAEQNYRQRARILAIVSEQNQSSERPVYEVPNEAGQTLPPWAQQRFVEGIGNSTEGATNVPQSVVNFFPRVEQRLCSEHECTCDGIDDDKWMDKCECGEAERQIAMLNRQLEHYSPLIREIFIQAFTDDYFTTVFPFNADYVAEVLSQVEILLWSMCTEEGHENCIQGQANGFYTSNHVMNTAGLNLRPNTKGTNSYEAERAGSTFIHEFGHAMGLGESLATLLELELARNSNAIREMCALRYPGFDKVLLERAGAQKFWTAAFTSNEAYGALWNQYIPEISIQEIIKARMVGALTGYHTSDETCTERCTAEYPNARISYDTKRGCFIPEDFIGILDGDTELLELLRARTSQNWEDARKRFEENEELDWDTELRFSQVFSQPVFNGIIYPVELDCKDVACSKDECLFKLYGGEQRNSIDAAVLVEALESFNARLDLFYNPKDIEQAQAEYDKAKVLIIQLRNEYEELLAQQSATTTATTTSNTTEPTFTTTAPVTTTAEPASTTTYQSVTTQPATTATTPRTTTTEQTAAETEPATTTTTQYTTTESTFTTTAPISTNAAEPPASTTKFTTCVASGGNESSGKAEQNPSTGVTRNPMNTVGFIGGLLFTVGAILSKKKEQEANKNTGKST
jgi:hypothetical protein